MAAQRLRVLVLSRNYPNNVMPQFGPWVARLVGHLAQSCEIQVVAPVPYCPPGLGLLGYRRFRDIARRREEGPVVVHHPRFLVGPGYSLYNTEGVAYYLGVKTHIERLRDEFPFDLIHAHFGYPDGVVGARLAGRYGVPVVVTEHALWRPWMDQYPLVRRQTLAAADRFDGHVGVSTAVRDSIAYFTGRPDRVGVIPNGVDGSVFKPLERKEKRRSDQILFVGVLNFNKGLDELLRAMQKLVERRPSLKLVLVGGFFYRNTQLQAAQIKNKVAELGLERVVEFVGMKTAEEVSRYMAESAVLVLPSRRESFGSVLVEALACGTPVVSTRCGGPEDIVNKQVGRLVAKEDPEALAEAIADVLDKPETFEPERLRAYALAKFSWESVAAQNLDMYQGAMARQVMGTVPASGHQSTTGIVAKENHPV